MPYFLLPSNLSELVAYYFAWTLLFLAINVIWDVATKRTPPFHLDRFKEKGDVLFSAAAFCSSLLILTSLESDAVQKVARDTTVPLILAGFSGLLRAIPALCPYRAVVGADPL